MPKNKKTIRVEIETTSPNTFLFYRGDKLVTWDNMKYDERLEAVDAMRIGLTFFAAHIK